MRFRNMRKGPVVGTDIQDRADDEIVNVGCETRFADRNETVELDPKSKAVQIYALAGYIKPVDKAGNEWLKGLKAGK